MEHNLLHCQKIFYINNFEEGTIYLFGVGRGEVEEVGSKAKTVFGNASKCPENPSLDIYYFSAKLNLRCYKNFFYTGEFF